MTEPIVQHRPIRFVRLPVVMEITGLSRSAIYQRIKDGRFPTAVSLGGRAVGWLEEEVLRWVHDRIAEARPLTSNKQLTRAA
jgi:prophage regulatory protein